jgi:hypothetical protein
MTERLGVLECHTFPAHYEPVLLHLSTSHLVLGQYLFKFIVHMKPFGYERPTPHLILTDNIHSDTQAEPRKLSSLTLYIDLWKEGKPAAGQNPPVISPPVVIFRRIGVALRFEPRTLCYPTQGSPRWYH